MISRVATLLSWQRQNLCHTAASEMRLCRPREKNTTVTSDRRVTRDFKANEWRNKCPSYRSHAFCFSPVSHCDGSVWRESIIKSWDFQSQLLAYGEIRRHLLRWCRLLLRNSQEASSFLRSSPARSLCDVVTMSRSFMLVCMHADTAQYNSFSIVF